MVAHHPHGTGLCDLPDHCLAQVFKHLVPLPDKFNVAASCWRFHRLVCDRRQWLVVAPASLAPEHMPGGRGPTYATLSAAVAASRPGDTIWLAPGMTHTASDCVIPWPLHLLGGGARPQDTWLLAPRPAGGGGDNTAAAAAAPDCALAFAAGGKVAMLTIATTRCPAIIHRRGCLTLQRCLLVAEPRGLGHLVSPLLTLAVGGGGGGGAGSISRLPSAAAAPAAAAPGEGGARAAAGGAAAAPGPSGLLPSAAPTGGACAPGTPPAASPPTASLPAAGPPSGGGVGAGRLVVLECQLMGGTTAVRCGGTGQPANVRAIYEGGADAPLLWLEVDSSCGGAAPPPPAAAAAGSALAASSAAAAGLPGPPWHGGGGGDAAAGAEGGNGAAAADHQLLLQQRSKAWQRWHAQQVQQQAMAPGDPRCPRQGLARISAVLGQHSINPATLAAHLRARQQQQQQQLQQ